MTRQRESLSAVEPGKKPDAVVRKLNVSLTLRCIRQTKGQTIRTFAGHSGNVDSVAFSPDGRTALSGSDDSTLKLWDVPTGRLRYSAVSTTPEGEWLAWTPEGFFAGTDWATHNLVHIVDGMNVIGIDQVYDVYYRPDLVAASATGNDISSYGQGIDLESLLHGMNFSCTDPASIAAQGISKNDITVDVTDIRAENSFLFFDTCDTGSFLSSRQAAKLPKRRRPTGWRTR